MVNHLTPPSDDMDKKRAYEALDNVHAVELASAWASFRLRIKGEIPRRVESLMKDCFEAGMMFGLNRYDRYAAAAAETKER